MPNVLVTGANGQLGSEMRRFSADYPESKFVFTDVQELDITDLDAIRRMMQEEEIALVVNCAAYTNVDKAEDDQATADLINHLAVANLAHACREAGAALLHVSTDYVFQGLKNTPCKEDEPTLPLGVYGKTKLDGELAVQQSGCNYMIFRTAWLYSAYGNNFVKTMLRLTSEREKLNVVFDQVGTPTYAADLAQLMLAVIAKGQYAGKKEIYHYSNEGVCSWYDFATEIAELAGHRHCDIQPCHSDEFPSKVTRPAFSVLDKTKVKTELGCKVPYWRTSLKACLVALGHTL